MHTTSDWIVAACAILGILVALIVPYLMRSDSKRSMAEASGAIRATLDSHGERIATVEGIVQEHTADIGELKGYLRGKANGAAAH